MTLIRSKAHNFFNMGMVAVLLVSFSCSRPPEGNPSEGKRWFGLYRCVGCHGENGSGGKGPKIAKTKFSYRKFLKKLRSPHSAIMPAFAPDTMPDQDAADIYAYLQSLAE
jgi:mono/diheme cytochrome c family protein